MPGYFMLPPSCLTKQRTTNLLSQRVLPLGGAHAEINYDEQTHALLDLYDSLCARPDLQLDMWLSRRHAFISIIRLHTRELTTRIGLSLRESAIFSAVVVAVTLQRLFYLFSLGR